MEKRKKFRRIKFRIKKNKFVHWDIKLIPKTFILIIIIAILFKSFGKNSKKIFNNYIHLALSVDNTYIYPSIVMLTSLLDNKNESTCYSIHILTTHQNFSEDSRTKINTLIDRFGKNCDELQYYDLGLDFKGATTGYLPLMTYYKVALPSLLQDVNKIIYSDSDVLNFKDLTEMYNIELNDNIYFCGALDYVGHHYQFRKIGIKSNKYINAGIVMMNLKAIRQDSIEKKIREFIATHTLEIWDQTAINCVCYNNTKVLPYKYASFAFDSFNQLAEINNQQDIMYKFNESELNQAFNEPTLLHYAGLDKPWKKDAKNFKRVYWWYYAKMSGFYQEILDHYKINKNEIEVLLEQIPEDGGLLKRNYKNISIYE